MEVIGRALGGVTQLIQFPAGTIVYEVYISHQAATSGSRIDFDQPGPFQYDNNWTVNQANFRFSNALQTLRFVAGEICDSLTITTDGGSYVLMIETPYRP